MHHLEVACIKRCEFRVVSTFNLRAVATIGREVVLRHETTSY
jgi:hypothetical protein